MMLCIARSGLQICQPQKAKPEHGIADHDPELASVNFGVITRSTGTVNASVDSELAEPG